MSLKGEKEEWSATEEEFREDADMQEEEYDDEVELDGEELGSEEYDEAQYSGDEVQEEFDEELEYEDEMKHDEDFEDDLAVAEYEDGEDSLEVSAKGEEYVDEYYMKKQRDISRQIEEDRQTSNFQKKIFSFVLLITIAVTVVLGFVIPNRITIDTSEFGVGGITPSIVDNGSDEYEVSFTGLGEILFTNHNAPYVRMVLSGISLHAKFLCDTPATTTACELINNGTTPSQFHPMSTWHRGGVIKNKEGLAHYELRIPKAIASSTHIREIMQASCQQDKKFRVEFRAEADILHEYSRGFSLPITDLPSHTFACVEPNQKKGWSL